MSPRVFSILKEHKLLTFSYNVQATFAALQSTYGFLTPELWRETKFQKSPMQEFTDFLAKPVIADINAKADY